MLKKRFSKESIYVAILATFVIGILMTFECSWARAEKTDYKFDFGAGKVESGYIQILPTTIYSDELGYGFERTKQITSVDRGGNDALCSDFCNSDQPFYFSIKLPEGNYNVEVIFGDRDGSSTTTVKAELRRLILEKVQTASGQFKNQSMTINIRTPKIPSGGAVRLKDREKTTEFRAWDEKLTLEFNNTRPCICALEINKADDIPTVYILGDSTVCDQPLEPWNSWGQMLARFFKPGIAIANHAESGESIRSSLSAGRIDKIMSLLKAGDYLFIQFGHNDMKDHSPNAVETYKSNLKHLVADARAKGAIPVLITSMERKSGVIKDTLGDYPAKVREIAEEDKVALIDLHVMSKILYKALGSNINDAFQDGTHHTNYGSYLLAKCVVEGIRQNNLGLAKYVVDDFHGFDPAYPDLFDSFEIPLSPEKND
jgi:lysophospholipase L1-like esterase